MDASFRGSSQKLLLFSTLLLALIVICIGQDNPPCDVILETESWISISCTDIDDFTPISTALATTQKRFHGLQINNSPQLIRKGSNNNQRFAELTMLDLSDNRLSTFNSEKFQGLANLDKLFLHKNNLTSIQADTFSGLESITRLRLNENRITTIEVDAIKHLKNLIVLDLSHNKLTSITPHLFHDSGLKVLDLTSNLLTHIDERSFNGLSNLLNLVLSHNPLQTIEPRAFQSLQSLTFLELRYTKLEGIDSRLFDRNPLTMLDLKGVNMENLANFPIYSSTLRGLRLASCNIGTISMYYFYYLPNLYELSIEDNEINTIEPGLFTRNTNLMILSLKKNQLKSISIASFNQIDAILKRPKSEDNMRELYGLSLVNYSEGPVANLDCNPWDVRSEDMVELRDWCNQHDVDFDKMFTSCN